MDELAGWLGQQYDEDERIAQATAWCWSAQIDNPWTARPPRDEEEGWTVWSKGSALMASGLEEADAQHIATHDPARVLREIDAKRQALAHYQQVFQQAVDGADSYVKIAAALGRQIRIMASIYADRPGFKESWRP